MWRRHADIPLKEGERRVQHRLRAMPSIIPICIILINTWPILAFPLSFIHDMDPLYNYQLINPCLSSYYTNNYRSRITKRNGDLE